MRVQKSFSAFTLAEVLITLGIIGVVAAMTMPTLINQTNGAQYRAAYKKALSAISQAITLNVALDDVSFADTVVGTAGSKDMPQNSTGDSIAKILSERMNVVNISDTAGYSMPAKVETKTCEEANKNPGDDGCTLQTSEVVPDTFIFLNDSSMFAYKTADAFKCTDSSVAGAAKRCLGIIDVNGMKGPNKVVTCDANTGGQGQPACTVTSPTDIYPVEFFDQTILPASDAAKVVLYGK